MGTRFMWISSSRPALRYCWATSAAATAIVRSPATARVCSRALSMPSVTTVPSVPGPTCWSGGSWVSRKKGAPTGCWPPHPLAMSKVRRPVMIAPHSNISPTTERLRAGCLKRSSGPTRSAPADHQSNSLPPPSPSGLPGPSLGPAMKPSSDIESPTTTLPIAASSLVGFVIETGKDGQGPYRASRVQMPAALKIAGDLFYAFVERPPRDGVTPSTKSEASVQGLRLAVQAKLAALTSGPQSCHSADTDVLAHKMTVQAATDLVGGQIGRAHV